MSTLTVSDSGRPVKTEVHSWQVECQMCAFELHVGEDIPASLPLSDSALRQAEDFARAHANDRPGQRVTVYRSRKFEVVFTCVVSPEVA